MKDAKIYIGKTASGGWKGFLVGRCDKYPNLRYATMQGQPHKGFEKKDQAREFIGGVETSVDKLAKDAGDGRFCNEETLNAMEAFERRSGEAQAANGAAAPFKKRIQLVDVADGETEEQAKERAKNGTPAKTEPPQQLYRLPTEQQPTQPVMVEAGAVAGVIADYLQARKAAEDAYKRLEAASAELERMVGGAAKGRIELSAAASAGMFGKAV